MNTVIKWYYQLRGYSSFWQNQKTGQWYAYDPKHMADYYSHEAERVPIPTWRDLFLRKK